MLRGETLVELKSKTGKIKQFKDTNMFTNAISHAVKATGGFGDISSSYILPLNQMGGAGLLLLDNTLDESVSNMYVPRDINAIGQAQYGQAAGTLGIAGTHNTTESRLINNGNGTITFRQVFDFDSTQANGEIKCIGLTHRYAPRGVYGGISSLLASQWAPSNLFNTLRGSYSTNLYASGTRGGIIYMDYDNSVFYTLTVYDRTTIHIDKYAYTLNKVSFYQPASSQCNYNPEEGDSTSNAASGTLWLGRRTITVDETVLGSYYSYHDFMVNSNNELYLTSYDSNAASSRWANGVTLQFLKIDMNNSNFNSWTVAQISVTNNTGVTLMAPYTSSTSSTYNSTPVAYYIYEGYMYIRAYSSNDIYKINITTSASSGHVSLPMTPSAAIYPIYDINGRIYWMQYTSYTSYSYYAVMINTYDFSIWVVDTVNSNPSSGGYTFKFIPIKGTSLALGVFSAGSLSYGYSIHVLTPYMGTINNLASPVVKTSDDTMKVSYVVTWSL